MTTRFLRRAICALAIITAGGLLAPSPAQAQITRVSNADWNQAFGFKLGYFTLKGDDARGEDDVIFRNRESLLFETGDFNGGSIGAEWLIALGDYLEAGADISYYRRTVPSLYKFQPGFVEVDVAQDLRLRIIPMAATVRFLPIGRQNPIQPYIGAGIAAFNWRYSETGEFVDFDSNIFQASFVAKGTEVGPVILGGVRFAVGDAWLVGGEYRYQDAKGDTGGLDEGFVGDKINLGGHNVTFGIHFRF